jgi:hypothetical protein
MRRTFVLLFLLLLLAATSVFAQPSEHWRASVFRASKGYGAAMAYAASRAWDVEAAVGAWSYDQPFTTFTNGVFPVTEFHHHTLHPIDLFVTRHLASHGRVAPFVHAGARYVGLPEQRPETVFENGVPATRYGTRHRGSAQAGGGVLVRLTPRTALRADVTRLLRSQDSFADPLTRVAAGVSWRF